MSAYDRLILEAERASELAELLPELRKLKSMPALVADAQTKVERANRVHQEVLARTEEASKALASVNAQVKAGRDALALWTQEAKTQGDAFEKRLAEREDQVIVAAERAGQKITDEAQARADELTRDAQKTVDDKRAEIASLNAEIERTKRDHAAEASKLTTARKLRAELQSL